MEGIGQSDGGERDGKIPVVPLVGYRLDTLAMSETQCQRAEDPRINLREI